MPRPSKCTPKRREAVIKLLQVGHGFEYAARSIGVAGATLRDWRTKDPAFEEACQAAADYAGNVAEHVLYARGLKGDTLALLGWLRAHLPHLYHRKMMLAVGGDPDAPPISIDHQHTLNKPRVLILPSNDRPTITPEQIMQEREAVARESQIAMAPPAMQAGGIRTACGGAAAWMQTPNVDDDGTEPVAEPEAESTWTEITIEPRMK